MKIISNSVNTLTGLGKQSLSLSEDLSIEFNSTLNRLANIGILNRNRNVFNIIFFLSISILTSNEEKNNSIAMSVVAPFRVKAVHFSSCHAYSLIKIYDRLILRLILRPVNIFYLYLELRHYKNAESTNIFLSNLEKKQFEDIYGKTKSRSIVLRPRLTAQFIPPKKLNETINRNDKITLLFISHNSRLKGSNIVEHLLKIRTNYELTVIGDPIISQNGQKIINLGLQNIETTCVSEYKYFIYPSKLDSHGFVLEEMFRAGLIPIYSSATGFGEFLNESKTLKMALCVDDNSAEKYDAKIQALESNWELYCMVKHELEKKLTEWESRNIPDEFQRAFNG